MVGCRGAGIACATVLLVAWGCSDLFHDTEWPTSCETTPGAPGCGAAGAAGGTGPGSGGAGGAGGGDATDFGPACAAWADAFCTKASGCFVSFFESQFDGAVAACTSAYTATCLATRSAPGTAIAPSDWQTCATWLATTDTCGELVRYSAGQLRPPECTHAGTSPNGSPCFDGSHCQSGACPDGDEAPCGTCAAPIPELGQCVVAADCAEGLGCAAGICKALGDTGAPCMATSDCYIDLVCRNGACGPRAGLDEACDPMAQDCWFDFYCSVAATTCQPHVVAGIGDPCGVVGESYATCEGISSCKAGANGSVCVTLADSLQACDPVSGPDCKLPTFCIAGECTAIDASTCP